MLVRVEDTVDTRSAVGFIRCRPSPGICAFGSTSLEDAVRNAVSLGGDADTLTAIPGALGEALHGLPEGPVRTAGDRYLQDVEDITGALGALYERGNPDEAPESRTDHLGKHAAVATSRTIGP